MIRKRCEFVMEDGHKCQRPFVVRTGMVQPKFCEEHRVRVNKSGLVRDRDGMNNQYVKVANAKAMETWVSTQMSELPKTLARIEEIEIRLSTVAGQAFHHESNDASPSEINPFTEEEIIRDRFLTTQHFKKAVNEQVAKAIELAMNDDDTPFKDKVLGSIATLNGRMNANIQKMESIQADVGPRITALNQRLDRMARMMETIETEQMELSAMLKHEKRKLKKRAYRRSTYVPKGGKENEEE